jgi:hypothetical protein
MSSRRISIVLVASFALAGCHGSGGERNVMSHDSSSRAAAEVAIVVDLTDPMPVGNGTSWKATVREVRRGALADATFHVNLYDTTVPCCAPVSGVVLELARGGERGAAQTFAAGDGTIWKIVSASH